MQYNFNCRSRNVFLRITDGKKYCYYGGYAWSCTLVLGVLAIFAHFTMDYDMKPSPNLTFDQQREQIGKTFLLVFLNNKYIILLKTSKANFLCFLLI